MPPNEEWVMPVHQEKKVWMMRMRTFLQLKVKQMMNQGGTNSQRMSRALSKIVSSPTLQMPLTQSMLTQSKMRQRRNQASKAHNVAKHASQKEQQRWLKAEILENAHGMRSAVHIHCLFLLKVRDKDFSSLLASPRTEEHEIAIQVAGHVRYVPKDIFNEPLTQVQYQGFKAPAKISSTG
ncbi:hypothetical protein O181_091286 [Austropuccinia psidii MF-1]|uniref:Uncharacterized protein n=1 Tax=Austropuccinia psidii MF-1 TaxID=1389203 RepID=A0A9Q3P9I2_9BASI|nr:hypothetical protein [Austropuccinia psidii MF-1]